jgi:hypothetical protein
MITDCEVQGNRCYILVYFRSWNHYLDSKNSNNTGELEYIRKGEIYVK